MVFRLKAEANRPSNSTNMASRSGARRVNHKWLLLKKPTVHRVSSKIQESWVEGKTCGTATVGILVPNLFLNQRQHQKCLAWAKERKNWIIARYFLHYIWESRTPESEGRVERRRIQVVWSPVKHSLRCHVICWCWSTVLSVVQSQCSRLPGNRRARHALRRCCVHSPGGLGTSPTLPTVPKAGSVTMILPCLIGQRTYWTWTPCRIYMALSRGRWKNPEPVTTQRSWKLLCIENELLK